jgi:hypothetical protein
MILSENRYPLFGIVLAVRAEAALRVVADARAEDQKLVLLNMRDA